MRIEYQFQPEGSDQCCQACIASISGLSTKQVCRMFRHYTGTTKKALLSMLVRLGHSVAERPGGEFALCKVAIVSVTKKGIWPENRWHCILWHDGKFFCPTDGLNPFYLRHPSIRYRHCIEIL